MQNNEIKHTTNFMRLWNEGATIISFLRSFFSSAKECKLDLRRYRNY
jgi:hypothetical protein